MIYDQNITKYVKLLEKLSMAPLTTTTQILLFKKNMQTFYTDNKIFTQSLLWIQNNKTENALAVLLSKLSTRFIVYLEGLHGSFTRLANFINANNEYLSNELLQEVDKYITKTIQQESINVSKLLDVLEKLNILNIDTLLEQDKKKSDKDNLEDK